MVCEDHFNVEKGLCAICERFLCEICNENLSITFCPICGKLICEADSVQIDNVRRVCKSCFKKLNNHSTIKKGIFYNNGAIRLTRRVLGYRYDAV